jgi:hypothetical protein
LEPGGSVSSKEAASEEDLHYIRREFIAPEGEVKAELRKEVLELLSGSVVDVWDTYLRSSRLIAGLRNDLGRFGWGRQAGILLRFHSIQTFLELLDRLAQVLSLVSGHLDSGFASVG